VNFRRQFSAIFRCHHPFQIFHYARNQASIVIKLLGAIRDLDSSLFADELIVGTLIDILEPTLSTYIKHKDVTKRSLARLNII
jgi:hypothetical protein